MGMVIPGAVHAASLRRTADWRLHIDALFERHDVRLTPSTTGVAPEGLAATAAGVSLGSITLFQITVSYSGRPDSRTVGSSGMRVERSCPVVARALALPAWMLAAMPGSASIMNCTWPPMMSVRAAPLFLQGTCTVILSSPSARC